MFNIYRTLFLALKNVRIVKITTRQILSTRLPTPLAKSAYFYMYINCFGLVRVVSSWLWVSSVAADGFGWVVADGFGWLRMIPGGFGWFAVIVVTFVALVSIFATNRTKLEVCVTFLLYYWTIKSFWFYNEPNRRFLIYYSSVGIYIFDCY